MTKVTLILICFILFISCKKEIVQKQFSGKWEYATFIGYPFNDNALPPGNGKIIVLGQSSSFERYMHDTLIFKGHYSIERKKDCGSNEQHYFLNTNDSLFAKGLIIDVRNDSLFLSTPNCYADGGVGIYRRVRLK
jgi:hypothetical protein